MSAKKVHKSSITGQEGVNLIERVVLGMGFLWYPTGGVQAGIDGFVKIRALGSARPRRGRLKKARTRWPCSNSPAASPRRPRAPRQVGEGCIYTSATLPYKSYGQLACTRSR